MADLMQYWQDEKNRQDQAVGDLQTQAAAQTATLQSSRAALATEQANLLAITKSIADTRTALATAPPADAAALAATLQTQVISQRASQAKILDLSDALATASSELQAGGTAIARAQAAQTAAAAALGTTTAEKAVRDQARAAITAAPLATLGADATAAKTGSHQAAAAVQINALPASLLALCTQQLARQKQRLADAAAAVEEAAALGDAAAASAAGVDGALTGAARMFRRAERVVLDLFGAGAGAIDRANGLFDLVAGPAPLLSPSELAAVATTPARDTLAGAAAAIVGLAATADSQARAYDSALLAAQAPDSEADVTATVAAAKAASDQATTDLANARAGFAGKADLDGWDVALPDDAWQRVCDYLEAMSILDDIRRGCRAPCWPTWTPPRSPTSRRCRTRPRPPARRSTSRTCRRSGKPAWISCRRSAIPGFSALCAAIRSRRSDSWRTAMATAPATTAATAAVPAPKIPSRP